MPDTRTYSAKGSNGDTYSFEGPPDLDPEVVQKHLMSAANPKPKEATWKDSAVNLAKTGTDILGGALDVGPMLWNIPHYINDAVSDTPLPEWVAGKKLPMATDAIASASGKGEEYKEYQKRDPRLPVSNAVRTGLDFAFNPDKMSKADALIGVAAAGGDLVGGQNTGTATGFLEMARQFLFRKKGPSASFSPEDEKAVTFIQDNAKSAEEAEAAIRKAVDEGEIGTTADLAQDTGISSVEAGSLNTPTRAPELLDVTNQRQQQILSDVEAPLGAADYASAGPTAQARMDTRQAAIEQNQAGRIGRAQGAELTGRAEEVAKMEAAEAQATGLAQARAAAEAKLATDATRAEASVGLQGAIDKTIKDAYDADVKPVWDKYDALPSVDPAPVKEARIEVAKLTRDTNKQAVIDFNKKYGKKFAPIKQWLSRKDGAAQPKEMSKLISNLREELHQSYKRGDNSDPERVLKDVIDAIDSKFSTKYPEYAAGVAATKAHYAKYYPTDQTKDILAKSKDTPELTASRFGMGDEAGAVTKRTLESIDSPESIANTVEYLKAQARRDGGVTDEFLAKHEDILKALPAEEVAKFRAVPPAVKASDAAEKAAEKADTVGQRKVEGLALSRQKAVDKAKARGTGLSAAGTKSVVDKYAKSPETYLPKLLNNADGAKDLKRLVAFMDKNGEGAAIRGQVTKSLTDKLKAATSADRLLKSGAADEFKKMRKVLEDSGLLSKAQGDAMSLALSRDTMSVKRRKQAMATLMKNHGGSTELDNIISSGLSAVMLTALTGTQSLMVGSAMKRAIASVIGKSRVDPAVLKRVEDMMIDPEEYLRAVEGLRAAKTPQTAAKAISLHTFGRPGAVTVATEEE